MASPGKARINRKWKRPLNRNRENGRIPLAGRRGGRGAGRLVALVAGNIIESPFPDSSARNPGSQSDRRLPHRTRRRNFHHNSLLSPEARLFIITGFLGGLTTFSTFSAETVTLLLRGQYTWTLIIVFSHLAGSLILTVFGIMTIKWLTLH